MKKLSEKIEESINEQVIDENFINEGFIDTMKQILGKTNKQTDPKKYGDEVADKANEIANSINEFDKVNGAKAKEFLSEFRTTVNKVSDILWKSESENEKKLILDLWANVDKLYDIFKLYSLKIREISIK